MRCLESSRSTLTREFTQRKNCHENDTKWIFKPNVGWSKKNRTLNNFIKSYEDPVNFKHFAGFNLSLCTIIPQTLSHWSPFAWKSCSFQNMFQMAFTALEANLRTSCKIVNYSNTLFFGFSLILAVHLPTLSERLNPVKNSAFWWSMTTLKLSPKTCLHYFVWIVSKIGLRAKCFLFGWLKQDEKNYCCNISSTKSTTTTWKRKEE